MYLVINAIYDDATIFASHLSRFMPRLPCSMGKDGLEQLLQCLGPSVKCLFHSKKGRSL